jgi:hypothetical protein
MEFFMLMGFVIMIFLGIIVVIQQRGLQVVNDNMARGEQAVADVVMREIRYAYIAGDGYQRHFDLPLTAQGFRYKIYVIQSSVASSLQVRYTNQSQVSPYVAPLPARVIDNTAQAPPAGFERPAIENVGGTVLVYFPPYVKES